MSLRLAPLHKFQHYLCSLNYYEDFKEELFNPELDKNQEKKETPNELQEIPLTFENADEYIRIWKSLFFVEAKAQIKKAEALEAERPDVFLLKACDKAEGFILCSLTKKESSQVSYGTHDFVIISHQSPEIKHAEHLVGIVEFSQGQEIRVKTVIDLESSDERTLSIIALLMPDSEWFVQKICNIVTLNREYQALQSVPELNLKETLLNPPENIPSEHAYFDIPEQLNIKLKSAYNFSQYNSIKECLKKEGVTLIQGPPGTGKTTTILGALSVLLNSRNKTEKYQQQKDITKSFASVTTFTEQEKFAFYRKAMPWAYENNYIDWQEDRENNPFNTAEAYKEKTIVLPPIKDETSLKPENILICAPSNAAIDEIIRKISEKGLFDENGNSYLPSLVRIGPNYHPSLRMFALDYLIEKEKESNPSKQTENIQQEVLRRTQIICSTLSVTGASLLTSNSHKFDTVVIDEAAQAVEISTLIPLKYDCKRLILIGDPKQLPATVFSRVSQSHLYDQSLFYRLQKSGYPVHLLKVQYRMHPDISYFISKGFYQSKLLDYEDIMGLVGQPEFYTLLGMQPITFFHVDGQESFVNNTYENEIEAKFVVKCYDFLKKGLTNFEKKKLGIITPYSGQASIIKGFIREHEKTLYCEVEVNSVDSFQGREKDLVIFSTVRSKYEGIEEALVQSIGFLRDKRRMNVGLSRARVGLIIVGDLERLRKAKQGHKWKFLGDYCLKKGRCFRVDVKAMDEYFEEFQKNPQKFLMTKKDVAKLGKEVKETKEAEEIEETKETEEAKE